MFARLLLATGLSLGLCGCCIPAPGIYSYGPRLLPPMLMPPIGTTPPCAVAPCAAAPCGPSQARVHRTPNHVNHRVFASAGQACAPVRQLSLPQAQARRSRPRFAVPSMPRVEMRRPKWLTVSKTASKKYPGVVQDNPKNECGCPKCRQRRQRTCEGCNNTQMTSSSRQSGCTDCQHCTSGTYGTSSQGSQPPQVPPPVDVNSQSSSGTKMVPPPAPLPPPADEDREYRSRKPEKKTPPAAAPKTEPRPAAQQDEDQPPVPEETTASDSPPQPAASPSSVPATTPESAPEKRRPAFEDPGVTPIPLEAPPQPGPLDQEKNEQPPEAFELEPLENSEIEPVSLKIPMRRGSGMSDSSKMRETEYETTTIPASSVIRKRIQ